MATLNGKNLCIFSLHGEEIGQLLWRALPGNDNNAAQMKLELNDDEVAYLFEAAMIERKTVSSYLHSLMVEELAIENPGSVPQFMHEFDIKTGVHMIKSTDKLPSTENYTYTTSDLLNSKHSKQYL